MNRLRCFRRHGADILKQFIGVALGAWLAFGVERCSRHAEEHDRNLEAGLMALASLRSMEETLFTNYCVHVLPYRESPDAWFDLGVGTGEFTEAPGWDAPSLAFLVRANGSEVYEKLIRAQEAYKNYAALVSMRNNLILEKVWPVEITLDKAAPNFKRRLAGAVGADVAEKANQSAFAQLNTRSSMAFIRDAYVTIHEAMKGEFGKDLPPLAAELWPQSEPDCTLIKSDGRHAVFSGAR